MRRFLLLSVLLCGVASAQTLTVTASHQTDGGQPMTNAKILWTPTLCTGQSLGGFRIGASAGQGSTTSYPATVTAGAFTLTVPDTAFTLPVNLCYDVKAVDLASGATLLHYTRVQPSSAAAQASWCSTTAGVTTCNFDAYNPGIAAQPTMASSVSGPAGQAATIAVGAVQTALPGTPAAVTNTGNSAAAVLNFTIPQGQPGQNGTNGAPGTPGAPASVAVGTVAPLAAGATPVVTNTGTSSAAVLNFSIPAGQPGQNGTNGTNGIPGQAASVAVGTVSPLAAGATPTVTNTGTSSAAVLNFGIPTGGGGGGITAAQALTAAGDGSIPASQTPIGTAVDVVAASDKTPGGNVITVGPSVGAHTTVFPLLAGSVIHDSVPGYEGHRYRDCVNQQKMHDVGAADGNACQWNHVTFATQPSFYFGQQSLHDETLWSFGAASNYSSSWRAVTLSTQIVTIANRGIGGGNTVYYYKQAAGDSNVLNLYSYFDAGWNTQSDEGMTGARNYVTQNSTYWHGSTTSSGTGLTLPVLSDATSGQNHTIDGTILLDISKGTLAGTITGAAAPLTGSSYLNTYPTSLSNLPLTTAWGICTVNFPLPSQATPQTNTPFTCTATLKAGTFTAGGLVWVAGPNYPEQAPITAVGTPSGGTQSITISVRNPQPDGATKGVAIFQGGITGQYASWDANLAQPAGLRTTQYAFGSLDGVSLITAFYAQGGTGVGHPAPPGCNAQAFCPGVAGRNGFHLYPGAEIVANLSLAHTPQLEPNGVVFSSGDLLENPPSDSVYMTGNKTLCQIYSPMNGSGSVCDSLVIGGQGAVANFYAHYTQNSNNPAMYKVNGGIYDGPTAYRIDGYHDYGMTWDIMPGQALFNINKRSYNGVVYPTGQLFSFQTGGQVYWDFDNRRLYTSHIASDDYLGQGSAPTGTGCAPGVWVLSSDARISACGAPYTTVNSVTTGTWAQPYARAASLSTVATSGSYADLANKPTIPTIPSASNLLLGGTGGATDSGISATDLPRLSQANTFTGLIVAKGGVTGDPAKNSVLTFKQATGGVDAGLCTPTAGQDCVEFIGGHVQVVKGTASPSPICTADGTNCPAASGGSVLAGTFVLANNTSTVAVNFTSAASTHPNLAVSPYSDTAYPASPAAIAALGVCLPVWSGSSGAWVMTYTCQSKAGSTAGIAFTYAGSN